MLQFVINKGDKQAFKIYSLNFLNIFTIQHLKFVIFFGIIALC